jgi:hypothetical protein
MSATSVARDAADDIPPRQWFPAAPTADRGVSG